MTTAIIEEPFLTPEEIQDRYDKTPCNQITPEQKKQNDDLWITNNNKRKTEEINFEQELQKLAVNPDIEQFVLKEIHKTVSAHDEHIIKAVFYAGISAYASPINLALKCESGSGKTYSTTQTIKFLPPEDVQMIGSQSPKVISHENGVLLDKNSVEIKDPPMKPFKTGDTENDDAQLNTYFEEMKIYKERLKGSFYQVELTNKIFVFLESVNPETFKMIKTTLSHDNEVIDHKYVDDHGKVHITRLVGFPTAIFNSLDNDYMSEFATRTLTITPTTTQPKIEASKAISNQKAAYPFLYKLESRNKLITQEYLRKIRDIIKKGKLKVIVPFPTIHQKFRSLEVRDMRDFNHFLEMVPAFTLLRLCQRPIVNIDNDNFVVSTVQDVLDAKALFDSVSATTKTGTEQKILTFYYDCVRGKVNGTTANILADCYNKEHKKVSTKTIQRWLDRLSDIEWVDVREGLQDNNHAYTYFPLQAVLEDENQTQLIEKGKDIDIEGKDKSGLSIDLEAFCQKDFDLWLETVGQTLPPTRHIIVSIDSKAKPLTNIEFNNIVRHVKTYVCPSESKPELTVKTETKPNAIDKHEMSFPPNVVSLPFQAGIFAAADLDTVAACTVIPKENRGQSGCAICSKVDTLTYQVAFYNGDKGDICTADASTILEHLQRSQEHQQ